MDDMKIWARLIDRVTFWLVFETKQTLFKSVDESFGRDGIFFVQSNIAKNAGQLALGSFRQNDGEIFRSHSGSLTPLKRLQVVRHHLLRSRHRWC